MFSKIKIFFILILIFIVIFIFRAELFGLITGRGPQETLKLGYCITMQEDAILLANQRDLELILLPSSGEALISLKEGEIDYALIGRKAKSYEVFNNIQEEVIKSGQTLVSKEGQTVQYTDLINEDIHTHLSEDIVNRMLPPESKVTYYDSFEQAIVNGYDKGEPMLIYWEDWYDFFELVVIMNGKEKAINFRGAFLYWYNS